MCPRNSLLFGYLFLAVFFMQNALAENPFDEAKISISIAHLSMPKITTQEIDLIPYTLRPTWGASFLLDLPIWRYLHSGFSLRYLVSPKKGDIGGIVDFGGVLKPMLGIEGSLGHLSLYLLSTVGLSVTFMPVINKIFQVESGANNESPIRKHVNVFGGLFNTSAQLGIEYFPYKQFGLFIEGGFGYWYFIHQISEKLFEPTFSKFSYHMTGILANAGVKFIF